MLYCVTVCTQAVSIINSRILDQCRFRAEPEFSPCETGSVILTLSDVERIRGDRPSVQLYVWSKATDIQ